MPTWLFLGMQLEVMRKIWSVATLNSSRRWPLVDSSKQLGPRNTQLSALVMQLFIV